MLSLKGYGPMPSTVNENEVVPKTLVYNILLGTCCCSDDFVMQLVANRNGYVAQLITYGNCY